MVHGTDSSLQKQVIYSVYVRNHTAEGTFRALIADLDRIKALETDIIWLMPIPSANPFGSARLRRNKRAHGDCPHVLFFQLCR